MGCPSNLNLICLISSPCRDKHIHVVKWDSTAQIHKRWVFTKSVFWARKWFLKRQWAMCALPSVGSLNKTQTGNCRQTFDSINGHKKQITRIKLNVPLSFHSNVRKNICQHCQRTNSEAILLCSAVTLEIFFCDWKCFVSKSWRLIFNMDKRSTRLQQWHCKHVFRQKTKSCTTPQNKTC